LQGAGPGGNHLYWLYSIKGVPICGFSDILIAYFKDMLSWILLLIIDLTGIVCTAEKLPITTFMNSAQEKVVYIPKDYNC
jgi:hypothetical protein